MSKQEKTGIRDLTMNNYRRKELFNNCYMTDLDAVEYRYNKDGSIRFAAMIDYKQWHVKSEHINSSSVKAQFELSKKINVPFYVIWYRVLDDELETKIWNVTENPDFDNYILYIRHFPEQKFIDFINNL